MSRFGMKGFGMARFGTAARAALLAAAVLGMGGCETVDHTMTSMKNSVSGIQWPHLHPSEKEKEQRLIAAAKNKATETPNGCPPINVMPELGSVTRFASDTVQRADNMVSSLHMGRIDAHCAPKDNSLAVDLTVNFEGELGPQANGEGGQADTHTYVYPYFVALMGKDGSILAKEVFAVSMTYGKDQATAAHTEIVRQTVPSQGGFENATLMIGFQLTDPELAYNRSLLAAAPQGGSPEWPPGIINQEESAKVEPVAAEPVGTSVVSADMAPAAATAAAPMNATEAATAAAIAAASVEPVKAKPVRKKTPAPRPHHKPDAAAATPETAPAATTETTPAPASAPAAAATAAQETGDTAVTEEELPPAVSVAPAETPPAAAPAAEKPAAAKTGKDGVIDGAEPPSFPPAGAESAVEKEAAPATKSEDVKSEDSGSSRSLENDDEWTNGGGDDITAPAP